MRQTRRRGPASILRPALLLALICLALPVANAAADQTTIDFESGPELGTPVTDQYEASDFVRFLANDPGFLPHRTSAPGKAHSGTVAADIGPDLCMEEGGQGADCEFVTGGTTGRLTRSADAVTLYAGLFEPALAEVKVQLIAYAGATVLATGPEVSVDDSGFDTPVTVSAPAGGIDRFALQVLGPGAIGAAIGFDDLTVEFPAHSLPEVSLSVPSAPISVLAGGTTETSFDITRLNGSSGPLRFSVSGLPQGVSAEVVPNPLDGTEQSAVLELSAEDDAPEVIEPATITLTADPEGDANVAQEQHSAQLLVRVARPFQLIAGDAGSEAALPDCTPVEVPITLARDESFAGATTLSIEGLPAGVSAQILPSATISPGGNLYAEANIRFSRTLAAALPASILVRATSAGLPDSTLPLHLTKTPPTATLQSGIGLTPRHLTPGTSIVVDGNGFCPGTSVSVGNYLALAPASIAPDGRSLTFNVPRLASTGPVTIDPPAPGAPYQTSSSLTVESFRNTRGFSFQNPPFGSLSLGELTEAFGADDLFIQINPCWPWGSCRVVTGIIDPFAAIEWGVIDALAHGSGGHCFGISRAVEQLIEHKVSYYRFAAVSSAFELPGPSGPSATLMSYLDTQHVLQFSDQFLRAWLDGRHTGLAEQLATLHSELAAGRDPIITMQGPKFGEGHAVVAYDEEQTAGGGIDVFVYDSNRPFDPAAEANPLWHKQVETEQSVIHFRPEPDPEYYSWSFDIGGAIWSGGSDTSATSDGKLFIAPQSTIPDNPNLPGLGALSAALGFGSAGGSVKTLSASGEAQLFPALDTHAPPGANGYWLAKTGAKPLTAKFDGVKQGRYSEVFASPGFAASLVNVSTATGVKDSVSGIASKHSIAFASGVSRPLSFALASEPASARGSHPSSANAATWSATIQTHASAGGKDTAKLSSSGTLGYTHVGSATAISFSLSSVRPNGGPEQFQSGRVKLSKGATLSVSPLAGGLQRVRLTIRDRSGHRSSRIIHSRARPPLRLRVTALRLTKRGSASVRVRISKLHRSAVLGVVLRLSRAGHAIAHRAFVARHLKNGVRTFTWRLPQRLHGSYLLAAKLRAVTTGGEQTPIAGSAKASRSAKLSLRRPRKR